MFRRVIFFSNFQFLQFSWYLFILKIVIMLFYYLLSILYIRKKFDLAKIAQVRVIIKVEARQKLISKRMYSPGYKYHFDNHSFIF